jgi:hypothetical protein
MREAMKVLCVVVFMFAAPAAAIAWMDRAVGTMISIFRYGCPVVAVLAIAGFLKLHFRADVVPDYLRRYIGTYFNRGGFCFGFRTRVVDGVCHLETYFQNQQDESCAGRVALRPARGFFLGRSKKDTVAIEIECGPAAFGVAKTAIPIPADLQGKRQSFEVGASVEYPNGKGHAVRFGTGIVLRANSNFRNAFKTTLDVAGVLTGHVGHIVFLTPATVTIDLPADVAEDVPEGLPPEIKTLWELGDPPLGSSAQADD